ncbi:unnamed protein product [Caenorhabditis bovis]|uniref:Uncharacterized protein n=1 Tax=Caenorhabditis bovis TaxID=2654633 RepID=A0A8S1FDG4_9PELO|nr:unnamed protein product [Caenorhabditis bovis]
MEEKDVNSYDLHNVKRSTPKRGLLSLMRYASVSDYILLTFGVIFAILQGCSGAMSSLIFRKLTDALIIGEAEWQLDVFDSNEFEQNALKAVVLYFTFGCVVFILAFISMACWHTFCERQIQKLRLAYFRSLLRQNWEWFDRHDCGKLTTRMSDGLERVRDGIGDKLGAMIAFIATFFAGITVSFYYSWQMSIVMLIATPFFFIPVGIAYKLMSIVAPKEQQAYNSAGSTAEEVINGIRTVLSFNGQRTEMRRYSMYLRNGMHYGVRKAFLTTFGVAFLVLSLFLAMAMAFWYGTKMVIDGRITPGTTFAVFWAFTGAVYALAQAAPQFPVFLGSQTAAGPILDIIDRIPPIDSQSANGRLLSKIRGTIKFEHVKFRYPTRLEVEVLKGVSLNVNAGENIALVGHSGSGKSTTAALLLHFYDLNGGRITIDGTDIAELNVAHLRNVIGIVSQEPLLFADTVENNIRLGRLDISDDEIEMCCRMANAHDFIIQLPNGYKSLVGSGGVQLSGGQKQRIAIARALARNPAVLILDEATSALDADSELAVQKALDMARQGRTTITIAHRLTTIRNCNRIYVFDDGNIVEVGSHEQLIRSRGIYSQMVKMQEMEKNNSGEEDVEKKNCEEMQSTRIKMGERLSRAFSLTSERLDAELERLQAEAERASADESGLLEILQYAKPEWSYMVLALVLSILRGLTFPIFSILYGKMFKTLAAGSNEEKLHNAAINSIYFVTLGILSGCVTMAAGCLLGYVGECLTSRLRLQLFSNILRQDGEYFDRPEHAAGRLTTRLATDAPNIRAAIDQRLADAVQSVSAVIGGVVVAFTYGPAMAPIGLLSTATLFGLQFVIGQFLKRRGAKDAVKAEEPSRLAIEAIEQYRTVQTLTREHEFVARFENGMADIHRRSLWRGVVQSLTYSLAVSYLFFNYSTAYRYGIYLAVRLITSPFTVFQVIEALNSAASSVVAFGTFVPEYVRARVSAGLLFRMLRDKSRIDSMSNDGDVKRLEGDVTLNNVYFSYPVSRRRMIIDGLNVRVQRGETLALVGASGCGKSTVIQLLERFYDPIAGCIRFDGDSLLDINLHSLRAQIALVGQQPTLFNYSIRENIAYGLESIDENDVVEAAKLANAHEFITKIPHLFQGYETIVGENGGKLSGGQKQRIAIARAIVRKPKILLLDEATSALDAESEKLVQEALEKAKKGRTCIVIAHKLSTIQGADCIAVMRDGKVIEHGTHSELVQLDGVYANLVQKNSR